MPLGQGRFWDSVPMVHKDTFLGLVPMVHKDTFLGFGTDGPQGHIFGIRYR